MYVCTKFLAFNILLASLFQVFIGYLCYHPYNYCMHMILLKSYTYVISVMICNRVRALGVWGNNRAGPFEFRLDLPPQPAKLFVRPTSNPKLVPQ